MVLLRTLTCTPGFPLVREAMTFESVANFDAGGIGLSSRARRPMYGFEIPLGILRKAEAESLSAFHAFHQGGKPFLWNGGPWATVENYNLVAEGDGATRLFYLPNRVITAGSLALRTFRPSTGATSNWAASSSNSWPFSLSANAGALSFANSSNTIPVSGDDLMARYACRYLCLFEPGGIKLEQISARGGGLWKGTIKLRETVVNFLTEGVVVPADAAFSPSDISGLMLWLKADAITGLNDGDAVTTWEDSSSQGNNVTQATAANKPLYKTNIVNGKPIVRFDGTNDTLESATVAPTPNNYSYFLVLIDSVLTGSPRALINGRFDGVFNGFRYGLNAAGDRIFDHPGIGSAVDTGGRTTNWEIVSCVRTSTGPLISGWINGASRTITNSTMAYTDPDTRLYVGGTTNLGEKLWEGDIAELIIYDSALSTADRQSVENHLNTKYNIY